MKDLKKRYWLFSCDTYYPAGGLNDIADTFDDLEEAKVAMENESEQWLCALYIFDNETHEQIHHNGKRQYWLGG